MIGVESGLPHSAFNCCTAALSHFSARGPILRGIELADIFLSKDGLEESQYLSIQMSKIRFLRISGQMKEARLEMERSQNTSYERDRHDRNVSSSNQATVQSIPYNDRLDDLNKSLDYDVPTQNHLIRKQHRYFDRPKIVRTRQL